MPGGFQEFERLMVMRGSQAAPRNTFTFMLIAAVSSLTLAGCGREAEKEAAPTPRPVRTVTVEKRDSLVPLTFTGRIEAEDEVSVAFRIPGRVLVNHTKLGDRVEAGQLLAQLESQNEQNSLRQAKAALAAAQGQLVQARNQYERQETLLAQGWTTRAQFEVTTQARQTAQAQVDAAEAALSAAHDLVGFTELRADAPGKIIATGPSAGEVVQAGQMIARIARQDGRDAVFDVPAQLVRSAPPDLRVVVSLTDDPKVTAQGRDSRDRSAGRSRDTNVRGQGRPDGSSRGDAAGCDRERARRNQFRACHRYTGNGTDATEPAAGGVDCRSLDQAGVRAQRRHPAI